jgi:hypothetical protein
MPIPLLVVVAGEQLVGEVVCVVVRAIHKMALGEVTCTMDGLVVVEVILRVAEVE